MGKLYHRLHLQPATRQSNVYLYLNCYLLKNDVPERVRIGAEHPSHLASILLVCLAIRRKKRPHGADMSGAELRHDRCRQ
jgi:hypothetical protein